MIPARPRPARAARLRPLLGLLCAVALGCGDDAAVTGATTAASASTSEATATATATEATDTSASTATAGSTSAASTAATTAATSDPTSDSTSAGTTTSTTTESTSEATTGTSTTTGTTSTTTSTTGDPEIACTKDDECALQDDCCACDPHHVDQDPPACDFRCDQSQCAAAGLSGAAPICRYGRCTFEKVACNPLGILCKSLPPTCNPGFIPGVIEGDEKCWSGSCVPAEACDWAPECAACDAPDLTCVGHLQKGAYVLCEPLPLGCGEGPATCACADVICESTPPWTVCQDVDDGIACECPFC